MGRGPLGKTSSCFQPCRCVRCCGVLGPFGAEGLCSKNPHDRVLTPLTTAICQNWHISEEQSHFGQGVPSNGRKHSPGKHPTGSRPRHARHWHTVYALQAGRDFTSNLIQEDPPPWTRASFGILRHQNSVHFLANPGSAVNVTIANPHQVLWWWCELIDNSKSHGSCLKANLLLLLPFRLNWWAKWQRRICMN